jgi:predicted O-linked N-acetylglucosamine transferase (SPINDLY family)
MKRCAPSLDLTYANIDTLVHLNKAEEAITAAQRALRIFPDDPRLKMLEALSLPILYRSTDEIQYYRRRFSQGLAALSAGLSLETPVERRRALRGVAAYVNFYLGYQGCDDRQLQQEYGKLAHRIVTANFPDWAQPVPTLRLGGRLRIGYISAFFRNHSVSKNHLGWLREHDRSEFEVYAYYLGEETDAITEEVRGCTTRFHQVPSIEDACRAIRSDSLHVAVFLDVGMNGCMTQLAALRLVPIQCVTWGHPVTSGLPTIGYFLSSVLMEPPDGPDHYSERLITLPGIGISFRKPVIPKALLGKKRSDYGLREDAVVYLCCQSISKYLPEHDDVFSGIAKRLSRSQFVFLAPNDFLADDFRRRLERALVAVGLAAEDHCVFLPEQDQFSYWNLNLVSDVFLDSLEWSGGVTTLEAIACGLPVVTLPGRFMRGRHSYGILTQLGVTDTIARDKASYVDIAVRLGSDPAWRAEILERMRMGQARLYSDTECVRSLESFVRSVTRERLDENGPRVDQ